MQIITIQCLLGMTLNGTNVYLERYFLFFVVPHVSAARTSHMRLDMNIVDLYVCNVNVAAVVVVILVVITTATVSR